MFAITSPRIAGLIAVVCGVVVAPQALAAPSAHTRIPPDDSPGYQQQQEHLVAVAVSYKSLEATTKAAAAIKALQRRSVDLDAAYRKLYPGAYRQAVQKSDKAAVWSFPAFCNGQAQAEYDYVYSGCQR